MKLRLRMTEEQLDQIQDLLKNGERPFSILGEGYNTEKTEFSYSIRKVLPMGRDKDGNKIKGKKIFFRNIAEVAEIHSDLVLFREDTCEYEENVICYIINNRLQAFYLAPNMVQPFDVISVTGKMIKFFFKDENSHHEEMNRRTEQMFGTATVSTLQKLKIGVVGVSGTGSIVAEQMVRLGIGELVLVDDDIVEEKNLNRILNSTKQDADNGISKVQMFEQHIKDSGISTNVTTCETVVANSRTIMELSQCDVLFGCLDSIDGRHHLNLLSTFYIIPYFDVGVKLVADGLGGINEVTTAAHYIKPGGSSLMSRHVYNVEKLSAASLKRENPEEYAARLQEKYIVGAQESSPAIISVNMFAASFVVLDFLARIHQYRSEDTYEVETVRVDLTNLRMLLEDTSENCSVFERYLGQGNDNHLLRSVD